jgi:uncharacterized protein
MSPESLAPGIYINEVTSLPHLILLAPTGTAGLRACDQSGEGGNANTYLPRLLRFFPAPGNLVIWGSRTTSQNTQWQSVNVRLLAVRIAQALNQRLRWAVFQNNGPLLWGQVASTVGNYLQSIYQIGALPGKTKGKKQSQAYFVKCDSSTMTQTDIEAGRLAVVVGFAPLQPAEFIIFQITVQTKKK